MKRALWALPLLLCACPAANSLTTESCDTQALVALGENLARMSPRRRVTQVWPGLTEACGDALPAMAAHAYDPNALVVRRDRGKVGRGMRGNASAQMIRAVCPTWDELQARMPQLPREQRALATYRACELARFELLDEDDLRGVSRSMITTWALYAWLREQGLGPVSVRPISRALFALEQRNEMLWAVPAEIQLPVGRGVPGWPPGTPVSLGAAGPRFAGGEPLDDGQLGPALREAASSARTLAEAAGDEWDRTLLVGADHDLRHAALFELLEAGQDARFEHFTLLVRGASGLGYGYVSVELHAKAGAPCPDWETQLDALERAAQTPPPASPDEDAPKSERYAMKGPKPGLAVPLMAPVLAKKPLEPVLSVELSPARMSVSRGAHAEPPTQLDAGDFAALTRHAEAFHAEHPLSPRVLVSASPDTPIQQLLATLDAARGPSCDLDSASACLLTEAVLLEQGAHGFGE